MAKAKERRERRRVSAKRRVTEHRVGGGSNYVALPEGVELFQPKAGPYRLDFMSYRVGDGNPFADEGDLHYERTFYVHRGVGPNGEWHLCAAKTLKKPCPVCEHRAELVREPDADEDLVKELSPKERQLFLVRNLEEPDDLLLWECSYHLFGAALDKKIRAAEEEDEYEFFADPECGMTLRVTFEQSDRGKWVEAIDIEFRPRKRQYDPADCETYPCLDKLLVATPYDRLRKIFLQIEDEPEKKPPKRKASPEPEGGPGPDQKRSKPSASKAKSVTAESEGIERGDEVTHEEYGVCVVTRISGDGTSLTLKDEGGDYHRAVGVDEVDLIPFDDEPDSEEPDIPFDDEPDSKEPDDDGWDEGDGDDPPVGKPIKGKSKAKAAKKPKPADDDDGWDED